MAGHAGNITIAAEDLVERERLTKVGQSRPDDGCPFQRADPPTGGKLTHLGGQGVGPGFRQGRSFRGAVASSAQPKRPMREAHAVSAPKAAWILMPDLPSHVERCTIGVRAWTGVPHTYRSEILRHPRHSWDGSYAPDPFLIPPSSSGSLLTLTSIPAAHRWAARSAPGQGSPRSECGREDR